MHFCRNREVTQRTDEIAFGLPCTATQIKGILGLALGQGNREPPS